MYRPLKTTFKNGIVTNQPFQSLEHGFVSYETSGAQYITIYKQPLAAYFDIHVKITLDMSRTNITYWYHAP